MAHRSPSPRQHPRRKERSVRAPSDCQSKRGSEHEGQLEARSLLLDAALTKISQGLCIFDRQHRLVLCNEQYLRMYGLSPAEAAPGTPLRELLKHRLARGSYAKGASPDAYVAEVERSLEKHNEWKKVTELDDGRFIAVENRSMPQGGWVATHQDVSDLRAAERRLTIAVAKAEKAAKEARAAHSTLLDAFEVVPEGLVLFDAEDRYVLWNRRYADLYSKETHRTPKRGMRFEDMVRSGLRGEQYPEARGREEEWLEARLARHRQPESSHEQRHADGRWVRIHEQRTAGGGSIGVRIDITASKLREEQLKTQIMLFDAALNNMSQGLVLFDSSRRVVICNRRYQDMFGFTADQVKPGTPIAELIRHRISLGLKVPADGKSYIRSQVERPIRAENAYHEFADGRIIAYAIRPMPDGGGIVTHEDVTDQRRIEARIAHMAHHDALTDLPNRVLLRERLDSALEDVTEKSPAAVLWLDLDRFKDVNDTFGHAAGDELLKIAAKRLRNCVRSGNTVARLGGDEFAVIQTGTDQPEGATALALRVIEAISAPYEIDGRQILVGTSVGISIAPLDAVAADELLKNADLALYRAKSKGRGTYQFFEPEMDARMHARRQLELDLRQALSMGGFELEYQPIIDLDRNEVATLEALLRWNHPTRGRVSPADFIPLAEESGLIGAIGEWVLRTACAQAVTWSEPINVAVNLSPLQFKQHELERLVFNALSISGLAPSRLELEITESVLLENTEATLATLHRLRELGVRISMDDFGTGYSSLSNLRSFPFNKIKIDQSFIQGLGEDPQCFTIVQAVAGLAAGLGMTTTAEGVETQDQLDWVRAIGITEVQGFHLSRPVPVRDVEAVVARLAGKTRAVA
jgi:diguanylate cyclase (GGDEF)-like protein